MIFKMTAPIQFELSPRGNSNSLKFAHEHLVFYWSGGNSNWTYRHRLPAIIITPSITSTQYKGERDKRYLPYIELGRWLCSDFQLETPA